MDGWMDFRAVESTDDFSSCNASLQVTKHHNKHLFNSGVYSLLSVSKMLSHESTVTEKPPLLKLLFVYTTAECTRQNSLLNDTLKRTLISLAGGEEGSDWLQMIPRWKKKKHICESNHAKCLKNTHTQMQSSAHIISRLSLRVQRALYRPDNSQIHFWIKIPFHSFI